MNGIRKPTFHAARYNRVKYLGSDVRSRPLQTAPVRTEAKITDCPVLKKVYRKE